MICETLECVVFVSVSTIALILSVAVLALAAAILLMAYSSKTMRVEPADSPARSNKMLKTLVNSYLDKMLSVTVDPDRESREEITISEDQPGKEEEGGMVRGGGADGEDHDDETALFIPMDESRVTHRRNVIRITNRWMYLDN